ncbi:pyrimidine 5'-nucleotidase [Profundibacterium mesophilum]|uniref:Phosphoglycolate phosphatase n=1 Tax=Profundibacterium mesophilum KAUST100406-0324 TaxID=1037889 RepID=A0A921TCQ4_9RHOB|nr:pyrimidine 5'-nucleotidase [Profundibacterium mesophilum]KAF0677385.1 phosphoglycolate phosphatase [Profundibacterium mesophilum KAUST100406-0324]
MDTTLFSHVTHWVFDLDNTLYAPELRLFDQIERKIVDYVMRSLRVDRIEADRLRHHYWRTYGTTLAGLMHEHGVDPDPYLVDVHDISLERLAAEPALAGAIAALPGRKIVYTNGSAPYARRVLEARGLDGLFDAVYGVENAGYKPKPDRAAFDAIWLLDGLDVRNAAMFEDDPRNLLAPHEMGMRTVHVAPQAAPAAHIHHHTSALAEFLAHLAGEGFAPGTRRPRSRS